jgi:hypothetical protein
VASDRIDGSGDPPVDLDDRPGGNGYAGHNGYDEQDRALALDGSPGYEADEYLAEERALHRRQMVRRVVDLVVLAACAAFVLWHLQPDLLLHDTTPAGGDMGAHVWGPAYLRDHLLPSGQTAGWTPDWYAGFPAYQFYMVVPSLLIVLLDAGIHGWPALLPAAVGAGLVVLAVLRRHDERPRRLALAGAVLAFSLVGLPYGVAFKLVSVSGLVTLPIAAYLLGRLSGLRFPTPSVLAVATLPFLFYRGFTIYGGNIASTLAGEFAFSMSLSLALVYVGVVFRGLETGRYRALAAVLLALTGLCHLIPAFWALGATAVLVVVRFRWSDAVRWLTPTLVVGGLLSAWWVGPFYLRRAYLNDMGWEKLPYEDQTVWQHLFPSKTPDVDLRWVFALALVGAGLSVALRLRLGIFLLLTTVAVGITFVVLPEGRLWNGRLLPFYYLTAMLLAGLAVSEIVRTVMALVRDRGRDPVGAGVPTALGALVVVLVLVGVPAGQLPFSQQLEGGAGYVWPRFLPWKVRGEPASFVTSWAEWNYSGYEANATYRE